MKITVNGLICTAIVFGTASMFAGEARAADAMAGKAIYSTKCRTCHGADGQGSAAMSKALGAEIKPLSSEDVQKKSDADLKAVITGGTGKMKPQSVAGADLDNVVAYIRSLKK